ncbi:MAG: phosphate acyltransferase [Planctomycetales bacterium]
MGLFSFDELYQAADSGRPGVSVIAAGGADATVLQALAEGTRRGWLRGIVTGRRSEIQETAAECGVDLSKLEVIDSESPAETAVEQISLGHAQILMKGQIATPDLMRAVLNQEKGLRTGRTLAQIVLMEITPHARRFLLADTGLCIQPEFRQKREILESLVAVAQRLGCDRPKVAVMSATEKVSKAMPDTEEALELQRLGESGVLGECDVQGPLSFDLAYASDAGDKKRLEGKVIGAADAMLFPDLLSGNLTVKGIMYTAACRFGGVIWGARCPIVFMSRADRLETRLNSLSFTLKCREAWGI